jgi:hypothetical protein
MAFDWKGTIGKVAPWLATTLGGPAAGLAVKAICSAVGLNPSLENAQKAAEMAAAGTLTGEQFLELQRIEAKHEETMRELGYQNLEALEAISYQDRDSARRREMTVLDWTPRILAYGVTIGFFGTLSFMMRFTVPPEMRDLLNIMLGALGAAWIQVISYYFGSSAGSARKDEILKEDKNV